jgi:hypothetical protein
MTNRALRPCLYFVLEARELEHAFTEVLRLRYSTSSPGLYGKLENVTSVAYIPRMERFEIMINPSLPK